jgi:hypothetical protein
VGHHTVRLPGLSPSVGFKSLLALFLLIICGHCPLL